MTSTNTLRRTKTGLLTLGMLIVLIGLGGCVDQEAAQDEEESRAVPVEVAEVQSRTLQETIQAVGTLDANQTVQISPEIAGRIENVSFREGDTVLEGDVLVELDSDKYRQRVDATRASLEEAQATLNNARKTYERNQKLSDRDVISNQQLDDSQEAFETARARVQRLQAELDEAQENLEDTIIRASFGGVVNERVVDAGNYVQPGQTLTTLFRLDPIEARFTVPERFADRVQRDQSVNVRVSAYPDTTFPGRVFFVSPSVREETRDLLVKAQVPNEDLRLRPGFFAQVELITETRRDRPVVPSEALVPTQGGYFLFVIEDGKAHRKPVEVGLREPGRAEVRNGLSPGDRVVRSGQQGISDGTEVRAINDGEDNDNQ